jgi:hypothetical protein
MAKFVGTFEYEPLPARRNTISLRVTAVLPDGTRQMVGTVTQKYIKHLAMTGWIATGADGSRGAHPEQWQAAMGLVWDGQSYHSFIHPVQPA